MDILDPWKLLSNKYQIKESLGIGTFGDVVKAKCLKSGKRVAIKLQKLDISNQYQIRKIAREIEILKHLSKLRSNVFSTNLVEVIMPFEIDSQHDCHFIFIVMEYVNSDLKKLFNATGQG